MLALRRRERRTLVEVGVAICGVRGAMLWAEERGCFALGVLLIGDFDFFICGVSAISATFDDGGMAAFFLTAVGRGEKGEERERGEGDRKSKVGVKTGGKTALISF